jgi:hypothetical protein
MWISSPVFCERLVSAAKNISNVLKTVDQPWREMLLEPVAAALLERPVLCSTWNAPGRGKN